MTAPVAPSFNDLLSQYEAEAQLERPSLVFREGDLATAQEHGAGAMADASIRYSAQWFKQTFIDGAEGDVLTALVDDHLNLQRQEATESSVDVTFTRTGNAAGTTPSGFTVATAVDASGATVAFTTNTSITWGASDHGPHTVTCTCTVLGSVGDVAAGSVTRIVDAPLPDNTIACTNALVGGGGNDQESDDQLRLRARNFWLTLRRGTLSALEEGALQVASVRVAKATEDLSTGIVTLVVGDSNGNSTTQMISDTEAAIEDWRAAGTNVVVLGATQLTVNLQGVLTFRDGSGGSSTVYGPLVIAAITARLAKLKQGERLYVDAIKAAGIAVDPDVIEALTLTDVVTGLPQADIIPTSTQTPRAGSIAIS